MDSPGAYGVFSGGPRTTSVVATWESAEGQDTAGAGSTMLPLDDDDDEEDDDVPLVEEDVPPPELDCPPLEPADEDALEAPLDAPLLEDDDAATLDEDEELPPEDEEEPWETGVGDGQPAPAQTVRHTTARLRFDVIGHNPRRTAYDLGHCHSLEGARKAPPALPRFKKSERKRPMEWMNYHHLYYFWMVAREGSVTRAAERLRLRPSGISSQIKELEAFFGRPLFVRAARNMTLTTAGETVFRYADDIFPAGQQLIRQVKQASGETPSRLVVGVAKVVPRLMVTKLLEPLVGEKTSHLSVVQEGPRRLLGLLQNHRVDFIITDTPTPSSDAHSHLLLECDVAVFAPAAMAQRYRDAFPASLHGAPFLMPADDTTLSQALQATFDELKIRPRVVGRFDDAAMMKAFGELGAGLFAAHSALLAAVERQFRVVHVGKLPIRERFYAVSLERSIKSSGLGTVVQAARNLQLV